MNHHARIAFNPHEIDKKTGTAVGIGVVSGIATAVVMYFGIDDAVRICGMDYGVVFVIVATTLAIGAAAAFTAYLCGLRGH